MVSVKRIKKKKREIQAKSFASTSGIPRPNTQICKRACLRPIASQILFTKSRILEASPLSIVAIFFFLFFLFLLFHRQFFSRLSRIETLYIHIYIYKEKERKREKARRENVYSFRRGLIARHSIHGLRIFAQWHGWSGTQTISTAKSKETRRNVDERRAETRRHWLPREALLTLSEIINKTQIDKEVIETGREWYIRERERDIYRDRRMKKDEAREEREKRKYICIVFV